MNPIEIKDVTGAVGGQIIAGCGQMPITGVAIDSRELEDGQLFVALPGERVDGHAFVSEAINGCAAAAVVSDDQDWDCPPDKAVIKVPSAFQALLDLACWYREQMPARLVAVTGSTGKTTAKDLIFQVLSDRFAAMRNQGNLNNEIGLPLTIFHLEQQHQVGVVELAMRGPGQIAQLAHVAKPQVGVITNVGVAHIELLGSRENIAGAKGELLDVLPATGLAVLNGDDFFAKSLAKRCPCPVVFFGTNDKADFRASNIESLGTLGLRFIVNAHGTRQRVHLPLLGRFNVLNALAAMAVGYHFGLSLAEMATTLSRVKPPDMRLNLIERQDNTLIVNDAYNSNPVSMKGALDTLMDLSSERRSVVIAGDMLELGELADQAHREIGEHAAALGVDCLITGGPLGSLIGEGAIRAGMNAKNVFICQNAEETANVAVHQVKPGDVVLVKASRGMYFEEVIKVLTEERRPGNSC